MSGDVFGTVTLEKIEKAVRRDPFEVNYNQLLLERFLKQQLKGLVTTGYCSPQAIKNALELFGIKSTENPSWQGEKEAFLNRSKAEIRWYTYIKEKNRSEPIGREWVIFACGGKRIQIEKFRKTKKRFTDISPEVQEKIKKRYPKKFM